MKHFDKPEVDKIILCKLSSCRVPKIAITDRHLWQSTLFHPFSGTRNFCPASWLIAMTNIWTGFGVYSVHIYFYNYGKMYTRWATGKALKGGVTVWANNHNNQRVPGLSQVSQNKTAKTGAKHCHISVPWGWVQKRRKK